MAKRMHSGRYFGTPLAATHHGSFSLQLTRYGAGERLPTHSHDRPYVCFVVEGSYRERCGADERVCGAGTMVVHRGGATHSDLFDASGGTCLNVEWDEVGGAALIRRCGRAPRAGAWSAPGLGALGRELADAALGRARQSDAFVLQRMSELAEELCRSDARVAIRAREPEWMARIERAMDDRLDATVDVDELARSAGVHRTTLLRAFWRHRGSSVSEALRRRRLDRAIHAITGSDVPLAEIADACGFADQSHLCRVLRAAAGTSPRRLRRRDAEGRAASCVQEGRPERG